MGKKLRALEEKDTKKKGVAVIGNDSCLTPAWAKALNELWAASFAMNGWNAFNMRKDGMAVKIMVKLKDQESSEWYTSPDEVLELAKELREEYQRLFPSHSLEEIKAIRDQIDAAKAELAALTQAKYKAADALMSAKGEEQLPLPGTEE